LSKEKITEVARNGFKISYHQKDWK